MSRFPATRRLPAADQVLTLSAALMAVAAASLLAQPAHAEGLYVGGALGAPVYQDRINGQGDGDGGRGPGFKLYGGWSFTPQFAVEGSVFNLGRTSGLGADGATGSARAWGLTVDAVGRWPVGAGWSLLGSAGVGAARLSSTGGSDGSGVLKLSLGAEYQLTPAAALRVTWDQYRFTDAYSAKPDVGALFLGVKMGF